MSSLSDKKVLVLITGASRGFGRSIAKLLAQKVQPQGSVFLLTARSMSGLEETETEIKTVHSDIKCHLESIDNEKPDKETFENFITNGLSKLKKQILDFDTSVIVHNSGSLGDQGTETKNLKNVDTFQRYFDSNLTSTFVLNAAFLNLTCELKTRLIVNVSSLMAIQAQPTWVMYCTGKAARDMFFKVMAMEEEKNGVRVISYAPGPLRTEMTKVIV